MLLKGTLEPHPILPLTMRKIWKYYFRKSHIALSKTLFIYFIHLFFIYSNMLHPIPILVIMESHEPGFDWVQACSSLQMPLLHNMPLTYCTLWWLWGSYDSLLMLAHNGTNKGFVSAIRCSCHKQVFKKCQPMALWSRSCPPKSRPSAFSAHIKESYSEFQKWTENKNKLKELPV